MLKKDLIEMVKLKTGLTDIEAKMAVEAVFGTIQETLVNGDDVVIRGFGRWTVKQRAPRSVRNINTGEQYLLPYTKRVVFEPGKDMKMG